MSTKQFSDKLISRLFIRYIELVSKTITFSVDNINVNENTLNNCILGFWHGNSYTMNLFIKRFITEESNIKAIVTADKRGNYIENVLGYYGVNSLRIPDGTRIKSFYKDLKEESKKEDLTLCFALDGPLGPLYEPKKLPFVLSNEGNKPFVGVKINLSKKITLSKRWDKYCIPLPFTKVKFSVYNFEVIDKEVLNNFNEYKDSVKKILC